MEDVRISDPFLKKVIRERVQDIGGLLKEWGCADSSFERTLDDWFSNFSHEEKQLALKVLVNLDYYSPSRYQHTLEQRGTAIRQLLHQRGIKEMSSVHLITTTEPDDSSRVHGYSLSKLWHLPASKVLTIAQVRGRRLKGVPIVLFNDTHGSGNQFTTDVYPQIRHLVNDNIVFVVGMVIAKEALDRFQGHLNGITVIPDEACPNAKMAPFIQDEVTQLQKIGQRICAEYPLGYGGTALLVAYFFQCPNNTLPIIWADGTNNGGYPWKPLFPYRPKTGESRSKSAARISVSYRGTSSDAGLVGKLNIRPRKVSLPGLPDLLTPGYDAAAAMNVLANLIGKGPAEELLGLSRSAIVAVERGDFVAQVDVGRRLSEFGSVIPEIESGGLYFAAEGYRLQADLTINTAEQRALLDKAYGLYDASMTVGGRLPAALRGMGRIHEMREQYDDALHLFSEAQGLALANINSGSQPAKRPSFAHEILRATRHRIHCILEIMAHDSQSLWHQESRQLEISGDVARCSNFHLEYMPLFTEEKRWAMIESFMALVFLGKAWAKIGNHERAAQCLLQSLCARRSLIGAAIELSEVERANIAWWVSVASSLPVLQKEFRAHIERLVSAVEKGDVVQVLRAIDDTIEPVVQIWHLC